MIILCLLFGHEAPVEKLAKSCVTNLNDKCWWWHEWNDDKANDGNDNDDGDDDDDDDDNCI